MAARRAKGEGSISKRKDGSWRGSIAVGPGGKRRYVHGRTKAEVSKRMAELRRRIAAGLPIDQTTMPLGEYLERWIRDEVAASRKPRTVESYRGAARHLGATLGDVPLSKLTPWTVRQGLNAIPQGRTQQHAYVVLHAALAQAVKWHLLHENPCGEVEKPRHAARRPSPPDLDAALRLLHVAEERRTVHAPVALALLVGLHRSSGIDRWWSSANGFFDDAFVDRMNEVAESQVGSVPAFHERLPWFPSEQEA